MQLFIVFTAVLVVAQASTSSDVDEQWKDFKKNYEKNYETEAEENLRKEIFAQNLKKFDEHNKKYEEGSVLYTMGVNQFADITTDEFLQLLNPMNVSEITGGIPFVPLKNVKPPRSIDWRKRGAVTPVKDQKGCGSCYAFSGTGALEGQLLRKTKKLVALSEQNLIDCSQEQNNAGCKGGYVHSCYQYVRSHGINSEKSYPYEGKDGECRYNPRESVGTTKGFVRISKNDEDDLLHAVGLIGPVSVLLTFGPLGHYTGGVFDGVCKPNKLNHAVLAVGYGTTKDGRDYWIIKNSHGVKYGEGGYLRLLRNKNLCGIASVATYPIV